MSLNPFREPSLAELEQRQPVCSKATADADAACDMAASRAQARPDDAKLVKAAADAQEELENCQAQEKSLARAIKVARQAQGDTEKKRIRNERVKGWDRTFDADAVLTDAFADISKANELQTDAVQRAIEAGRALHEACPVTLPDSGDLHGFIFKPDSIAAALKADSHRAGLDIFVSSWPEDRHSIPTLAERRARLTQLLKIQRDADLTANGPAPAEGGV